MAQIGNREMEQRVSLHGAAGALEATVFFGSGAELEGIRADGSQAGALSVPNPFWDAVDRSKPFMDQIGEVFLKQPVGGRLFIDSILARRSVSPNFYDGWKAQQVIDAAIESHTRGTRVVVG